MNSPSGRPPATAEDAVRQVALACRILARFGHEDLTLGHASVRGPAGRTVYIKRKGKALRNVLAGDVIGIALDDPDGYLTRGAHLETIMHLETYLARPDVGAVIHTHPMYSIALGATAGGLEVLSHDGLLFPDGVPVFGGADFAVTRITVEYDELPVAASLAAGAHPVSMATVRMGPDGSVTVLVGTTELGQGARTVMAQIAAGVLGSPVSKVVVRGTDTRYTPYDRSTGASRSTTVAGLAVQRAAQDVLDALVETAAARLEAPPQLLTVADGAIADQGGRSMTHAELVRARFGFDGGELIGHGRVQPEGGSGSYAEGPVFWEVCVAGAEVEVDTETGVVTVLRTSTVADVGRAINPQLVARQDEGATLQGIGNALFEEMVFAPDGMLLNDTLLSYRIPAFRDIPPAMHCSIVENGDGPGPFGAKGCGEGALAAIPAAVVNALADAGVPMNTLPLTPERVWRRIQDLRTS